MKPVLSSDGQLLDVFSVQMIGIKEMICLHCLASLLYSMSL
jgi:hypothetical protein